MLQFTRQPCDHGADDYERAEGKGWQVTAQLNGQPVGTLDYEDEGAVLHVRYVNVDAGHRRCGIATAMLDHARDAHRDAQGFDTNDFDPDGAGQDLWASREDCWLADR